MEEITVNATMDQINDFKSSILWSDIVRELESWKHGFDEEMYAIVDNAANADPSTASVLLHLGDLHGRRKAVDYLIGLPDMFLQLLKDKTKSQKEDLDNA